MTITERTVSVGDVDPQDACLAQKLAHELPSSGVQTHKGVHLKYLVALFLIVFALEKPHSKVCELKRTIGIAPVVKRDADRVEVAPDQAGKTGGLSFHGSIYISGPETLAPVDIAEDEMIL
jgi:hypothetical protein